MELVHLTCSGTCDIIIIYHLVPSTAVVLSIPAPVTSGDGTYRLDLRVNSSGDAAFLLEAG